MNKTSRSLEAQAQRTKSIKKAWENPTDKMIEGLNKMHDFNRGKNTRTYSPDYVPYFTGKTMKQICGEDYVDPRKGKTCKEIYGEDWVNKRKGKTVKELYGEDYIDPRSKPFKLESKKGVEVFLSEVDCINNTNLNSPTICKLRKNGSHVIKRLKNTKHTYENGDVITYTPLTIDEYKELKL